MGSWCILALLWVVGAAGLRLGDVNRRDSGDSFQLFGQVCDASACSEHGAGASTENIADGCACACPQRAPLFREDRELCVDDLPECSLATFGSGNNGVQKIPFVYLPLKGQIIHPSREITFYGVKTPICAVSGAQFLTRKGFVDLRNTLDADVPFSLFRDEGRTFLQWSGEDELRIRMSGRVMVVRLLCRDVSAPPAAPLDLRGVFTPCVAFRVQGTSIRQLSNVSEVQFATNAQTSETKSSTGLSVTEYVAIGISSLLLGLIYVASVFLYLHTRKRRKIAEEENERRFEKGIKRRDGKSITEHDIVRINNERIQTISNAITGNDSGVVKKNPLLSMGRQYQDIKNNFTNDSGSKFSDSEDYPDTDGNHSHRFNSHVTSAVVHPTYNDLQVHHENIREVSVYKDESGIEKLPDEHVSIVETTDDREITRPVGTTRRKLYFNPAYFEPHLMAEPPQAAIEFLSKIREVITIAKHKMATKRFRPVLNEIPEEETYPSGGNSIEFYQGLGSQRSGSVVSLKRENSRKRVENCIGCPGCKDENNANLQNLLKYDMPTCSNCIKNNRGDKQNSIREWLENIPNLKQNHYNNEGFTNKKLNSGLVNSLLSLTYNDNRQKIKKQNSFNLSNPPLYNSENMKEKRNSSSMSVKSEPTFRNYNFPIGEIDQTCHYNNLKYSGQTISRISDIKPIGIGSYRPGSYRNNPLINQKKNKFITNKNALPDMVNEAIALEHGIKSYSSSDEERLYNKIRNNSIKKTPRTTSESPPANDYETDSLERSSHKKGISTPSEYVDGSSSQASPSLSAALPLEEELTMRNDVYKRTSSTSNTPSPVQHKREPHNHYETIAETVDTFDQINNEVKKTKGNDYNLVSEVYVNNYNFGSAPTSPSGSECSMGSRKNKKIITPIKSGSLTIEVKDSPENYIKIHESDSFEPDTLDRKNSKCKNIEPKEKIQFSRKHLLQHLNNNDNFSQNIQLRSSGTFTKVNGSNNKNNETKFCSLRVTNECRSNIFTHPNLSEVMCSGSKSLEDNLNQNGDDCNFDWDTEEGRVLTLELRHSKRQRQITPPKSKPVNYLPRPDILPPLPPTDESPIYEHPVFPPRRVQVEHVLQTDKKNVNGRSLSPMLYTNDVITKESLNSSHSKSFTGHYRSPMRASVRSRNSDCENGATVEYSKTSEGGRSSYRRRPSKQSSKNINTNTYVKTNKDDAKFRFRRRKGTTIEDSGYLSSDSTSSRQIPRKVVAHVASYSESDDTENEARSESGAESVETHSVFFGSFRKARSEENGFERSKNDNFKRLSSKKIKFTNV